MSFPVSAQLLDACVLSVIGSGDTYGYELTQSVKRAFELSESTLYPVLRRLQKDGCLDTYDQPYQGRNRRYYSITVNGLSLLADYRQEWREYRYKVDQLLTEGTPL